MLRGKYRKALLAKVKNHLYETGQLSDQVDERLFDNLKDLYLSLNDELFNGELPLDLTVVYSFELDKGRTKSTCYGKCYYKSDGTSSRGHRKNCRAVKIEIKPGMTVAQTRKTLVHEMCHAYCFNKFGEVGHGRQFWIKMRKCGYPKGHKLPDQSDKWSR